MIDSDQLDRDRGLNAMNGRAFADPDEERAARALMGAPFPATTEGLIELNTAVSGNSGVDPDEAARNWIRDNGFDKPIGK